MSRRSPRPLANALAPLQSRSPRDLLAEVRRAWPDAAGAAIAREAAPVSGAAASSPSPAWRRCGRRSSTYGVPLIEN